MQDVEVADDEASKEPVAQVHDVVVIEVVEDVLELELAVIVVGVHLFRDRLVQALI